MDKILIPLGILICAGANNLPTLLVGLGILAIVLIRRIIP